MSVSFEASNSLSRVVPPRTKKGVKFADEEEVHDVLRRVSQMSRKSKEGIWFGGEDFDSFIEDVEKSVYRMELGKRLSDKKSSTLGLECRTQEGSALRKAQKECAWDMVLWEQERQEREGTRDSLLLADAYHEASQNAAVRAVLLARQVSDEVLEDYAKICGFDTSEDPNTFQMSLSDEELGVEQSLTKPTKVRFAEEPEVYEVLRRRSQISRKSKTVMWFGGDDFEAFMNEVEATVDKIEHGEQVKEEEEETPLGLEGETQEGIAKREATISKARNAVLDEQEQHWDEGSTSAFYIAKACHKVSKEDTLDAALNATALARQVSNEVYHLDED